MKLIDIIKEYVVNKPDPTSTPIVVHNVNAVFTDSSGNEVYGM